MEAVLRQLKLEWRHASTTTKPCQQAHVSSDPDSNFNAAEDLMGKLHVIVACMKYFGMEDVN